VEQTGTQHNMSYTRLPATTRAGVGMRQTPTTDNNSLSPVTLDSDISTTGSLGVVQIGSGLSITPAGVLSTTGSGSTLINVKLTAVNYTALATDYYIGATKKNITITLPLGITGKVYIVKNQVEGFIKVKGTGQNLDNSGDKTLGSEKSLFVVFDGARWNIID
jgi:hypothetical protein